MSTIGELGTFLSREAAVAAARTAREELDADVLARLPAQPQHREAAPS
jgi:hypothetical protein